MVQQPKRPVLRWHGGKWRLAQWVISHFPAHRLYTEAFGGAGSVLMQKSRAYAEIYNDLDGEVVNVFRVLRDPASAAKLERLVRFTPFSRMDFLESYRSAGDAVEAARRTIIRSFMGFGSSSVTRAGAPLGFRSRASTYRTPVTTGFRANSNRAGSTPAVDWATWPEQIRVFTQRLAGVVIENRDAIEIIRQHDREDALHYVDPPYLMSTRGGRHEYRHEMTDEDHSELSRVLKSCRGGVIISGYHSELYDQLYRNWKRVQRKTLADGARVRTEVLWMNKWVTKRSPRVF